MYHTLLVHISNGFERLDRPLLTQRIFNSCVVEVNKCLQISIVCFSKPNASFKSDSFLYFFLQFLAVGVSCPNLYRRLNNNARVKARKVRGRAAVRERLHSVVYESSISKDEIAHGGYCGTELRDINTGLVQALIELGGRLENKRG